jgi:transglutaminase-like putative cysteine protease
MTNPRHLFILLGFLAQGLTWESYPAMAAVAVIWALSVTKWHHKFNVTLTTEAIALIVGCVLSLGINRLLQRSAHFFLGDALILLQLCRLMRPLSGREKLTSLIIAAFHFGVLCTLAPNIRFVTLFTAALFFLPGALKEIYLESTVPNYSPGPDQFQFRFVPTARVALWLLLGSGFVFITFPRFTGSPLQLRESLATQTSLLDSVLDPRRGGQANSKQILMQIEGDNIDYLRCFSLTELDGTRWHTPRESTLWPYQHTFEHNYRGDPRYLHRRVHVKTSQYLGNKVPVDGTPLFMRQNFFARPARSPLTGTIEPSMMWTTGNNVYEYYIDTRPVPEILAPAHVAKLTNHPPQTERLISWLADVTSKGTNALQKAMLVQTYLRNQFEYRLGTPELSRLAPIDDFVFNRKEGHCERFAAAMALFLRMQGVPSRVVIGYVPTTRNLFTGRVQVRFSDAHAWAEGYFEGVGWMNFDATPGPSADATTSNFKDMLEALDFAWYSHVVNFNGFAQKELAAGTMSILRRVPPEFWTAVTWFMIFLLATSTAIRFGRYRRWKWRWNRRPSAGVSQSVLRHHYDRMLHIVAQKGLIKNEPATPLEFADEVEAKAAPLKEEVATVTSNFCRTFYGEKALSKTELAETEQALKRLKERCSAKSPR